MPTTLRLLSCSWRTSTHRRRCRLRPLSFRPSIVLRAVIYWPRRTHTLYWTFGDFELNLSHKFIRFPIFHVTSITNTRHSGISSSQQLYSSPCTDINCDLVIYYCLIRMVVVFADTHTQRGSTHRLHRQGDCRLQDRRPMEICNTR